MLIFNQLCLSQNNNKIEFMGTLAITGGDVLSYKIVFNQTTNNEFTGYSITDFYGKNLTRTSIIGKYDTINNTFSFHELKNINTKMNLADSTFCFVTTKTLKIRNIKGNKIISGAFKGAFPSGESCAEGMIYLVESKLAEKIKAMTDTKPISSDSTFIVKDNKVKKSNQMIIVKDTIKVLTSNQNLLMEHWSKNVSIEVWDGSVPDNDMIRIFLNDKILKENITLTSQKEIINLPSTESKFKLKFVALNEGYSGLNTLDFKVINSYGEKKYVSVLRKGESFEIEFKEK